MFIFAVENNSIMAVRYEKTTSAEPTHPGTILGYELEERNVTTGEFAEKLGIQCQYLDELVKGRRPMTRPIAEKVEILLGLPAVTMLHMQARYDQATDAKDSPAL